MAKEELSSDFDSNFDATSIVETKSAVLVSALFVLRKLVFNQKRYGLNEEINHEENLLTYINEFKNTLRLFEYSLFEDESENVVLEQYLFKVQLHESLYKIHHTLLSIMPFKIEHYIEEIDFLLKKLTTETDDEFQFSELKDKFYSLVEWFDELVLRD